MMEMISVIIPVYHAEKTISACIRAVREQTYEKLELILINDGSRDGSGALCDQFAAEDPRIRVFHQENAGVSAARNLGLSHAAGEYITFLDADDIIPCDYLEILCETCRDADISVCDVVCIQDGQALRRFTLPEDTLNQTEVLNYLLRRQGINSGPCAKLFRRAVVQDLKFPPLKAYEDILFVREAFCRAEKIAITNRTEYRYIQNPEGAMSQFFKIPSADIIKASESLLEFIAQRPDLSPETFYITVSHLMQYVQGVVSDARGRDFVRQVQRIYRRYVLRILTCSSFPRKEKIVYTLFALGWFYKNHRFIWIGG